MALLSQHHAAAVAGEQAHRLIVGTMLANGARHQPAPLGWHRDFADARQRLRDWVAASGTRLDRDRPTRQTAWPGEELFSIGRRMHSTGFCVSWMVASSSAPLGAMLQTVAWSRAPCQ